MLEAAGVLYVILALATLFLFVIALMLLGKVPAKSVCSLAGIIGVTGTILILYMVATDALSVFGPTASYAAGIGAFVFFMIYILIAFEVFTGTDFKATGWFALIGGTLVFLIGLGFLHVLGTALPLNGQFGAMFLVYAVAFWIIFLVFGLGQTKLTKLLAWYLLIPTTAITVAWPIIMYTNAFNIGRWFPA